MKYLLVCSDGLKKASALPWFRKARALVYPLICMIFAFGISLTNF